MTWVNPEEEYHDDETLNNYLNKEFTKPKFKVGDILHHKDFNIYGVVTYVNYENRLYSIVTESGEAVNDYNDFKSVDDSWEVTDRRLNLEIFLNAILNSIETRTEETKNELFN